MQHLVGAGIVGAVDVLVHVTDFEQFGFAERITDADKRPVLVETAARTGIG